jgi:radical SAM-linked protein
MRIWIQFKKESSLRFLSHLDLMRVWQRAVRRARLPIAYSAGFNPHPKISFASALAVGIASDGEYVDIQFDRPVSLDELHWLRDALPEGLTITAMRDVPDTAPALMSLVRAAHWVLPVAADGIANLQERVSQLLQASSLPVQREGKKGTRTVDIRPMIYELRVDKAQARLHMLLASGGEGGVRPQEVTGLLGLDVAENKLHRDELYLGDGDRLQSPMHVLLREKEVSVHAEKDYYQL